MSADILGFGGVALTTIGTVAITKEAAKTIRSVAKPKKMKSKKKMKKSSMYSMGEFKL